jgi:hypothetical protein
MKLPATDRAMTAGVVFVDEPSDYGAPGVTHGYLMADDDREQFVLAVTVSDMVDSKANGERFARAINSHDALVDALKRLLSLCEAGGDPFEEPNRVVVNQARAALSLAGEKQP